MERITTISETRALILRNVMNALGKKFNISVDCEYDEDKVNTEGQGIMTFNVSWPTECMVDAEDAHRFADRLNTISYYCKLLNELNLGVVTGKDSVINTKELEADQEDYIYHLTQCLKADRQIFKVLRDFAYGVYHWEDGRTILDNK